MNTQSLVTWNYTLADQQGYLLERSTNSGSVWSTLLSCSLATTSYYDTDLWWGSSLWYRVAAINGFGRGPRSSTAYVYINYPGIDTPILSGSQVAAFQTASALSWSYSGSAIGSAVSFSLERSTNGGSTWTQVWAVSPTGSAFIDNPLAYATTASYRIRAACDFGLNGPYSNIATVLLYPSNDIPELDWITAFQNYAYAPTSSVSWSYSGDPDYAPTILECDITLDVVKTWDLSELTASDLYSIDDIVWNAKDRTLNAWSYGGNDGFMTILDPMANTVVCQKNVIAGESPMGGSAGHVIAANPRNGYIYIPQRMDGDAGSSLTGSIKIYRP